jgi:hypothetical protein
MYYFELHGKLLIFMLGENIKSENKEIEWNVTK